jgi:hypothetical protein
MASAAAAAAEVVSQQGMRTLLYTPGPWSKEMHKSWKEHGCYALSAAAAAAAAQTRLLLQRATHLDLH